jgi:hypothetical protein
MSYSNPKPNPLRSDTDQQFWDKAFLAFFSRIAGRIDLGNVSVYAARIADEAVAERRKRLQSANAKEPQPANEPAEERQRKVWTGEELYALWNIASGDAKSSFNALASIINEHP